jgi:hypothetical protein
VFVADVLPSSLLRIIEFLNGQMDPCEVLGVELRQYLHHDGDHEVRAMVPRVHGVTATSRHRKRVSRTTDNPGIYFLEPVGEEFETHYGMRLRRRSHRIGSIRLDHPDGPGYAEWNVYQSRAAGTVTVRYDPPILTLASQQLIVSALQDLPLPRDIEVVGGYEEAKDRYFVRTSIPGFQFDDDANWEALRVTLRQTVELFLRAVRSVEPDAVESSG